MEEPVQIIKDVPSAPPEVESIAPTTFSMSLFSESPQPVYPDMHTTTKYVQKTYEERITDKEQTNRITGTVEINTTPELNNFSAELAKADALKSSVASPKEPNWVQGLVLGLQSRVGDRTPKTPVMRINDPDFYQKYFNGNYTVRTPMALNPEYTAPGTHLLKRAMSMGQPATMLAASGLSNVNSLQLQNIGLNILDFRILGRSASDMQTMFTSLDKLEEAGFCAKSFDAVKWSLEKIASAYNSTPFDVAEHFKMIPSDFVAAGVTPSELDTFGVKINHLVTDPNFFKILVAAKLTPEQFMQKFDATPRSFFNQSGQCILRPQQTEMLRHINGWNEKALVAAGFESTEIKALKGETLLREHP